MTTSRVAHPRRDADRRPARTSRRSAPTSRARSSSAPSLCKRSKLVVDDRALALTDGALNVAATAGELDASAIHAELGEVLVGRSQGRERDDEITIFGAVGLAWQDLVAAELCYRQAVEAGAGTFIDF